MDKTPNNISYNASDGAGAGRVNTKVPVYTTDKRRNKFSQRTNKKWIRLATVFGYIVSVSAPAVMLSMYYLFFWDPGYVQRFAIKNATTTDEMTSASATVRPSPPDSRKIRDLGASGDGGTGPEGDDQFMDASVSLRESASCTPCTCDNGNSAKKAATTLQSILSSGGANLVKTVTTEEAAGDYTDGRDAESDTSRPSFENIQPDGVSFNEIPQSLVTQGQGLENSFPTGFDRPGAKVDPANVG